MGKGVLCNGAVLSPEQGGFLRSFFERTAVHPKCSIRRVFRENVEISVGLAAPDNPKIPLRANQISLNYLLSRDPAHGHGRAAMSFLTSLADDHGLDMGLDAFPIRFDAMTGQPIRYASLTPEGLMPFYRPFGFKEGLAGSTVMWRPALVSAFV